MKFYLLLLYLLMFSCGTGKTIPSLGIEEIQFGSGGGFTGEVKTYTLTSDSRITEKNAVIRTLDAKTTAKLFKEANALKDYSFQQPENMYSFLVIKTSEKTNRIVWGSGSSILDQRVTSLHKALLETLK